MIPQPYQTYTDPDPLVAREQGRAEGLALGQRLAALDRSSPPEEAWAAGWHDGWAAAEYDMAEHWRAQASAVRQRAGMPSAAQLAEIRAAEPRPCWRRKDHRCSVCIRAEQEDRNRQRYGSPDFPGLRLREVA